MYIICIYNIIIYIYVYNILSDNIFDHFIPMIVGYTTIPKCDIESVKPSCTPVDCSHARCLLNLPMFYMDIPQLPTTQFVSGKILKMPTPKKCSNTTQLTATKHWCMT